MLARNNINIKFEDIQEIYFLGIGGIGMSALARYFLLLGKKVTGYDKTKTPLTEKLVEEGMEIHYDENPDYITEKIDMVIFTPAIPKEHKEWDAINSLGKPVLKRAEVLGLISRNYKTVAVAGTHGKTSTSSMTSCFLRSGGIDVSAFLGGIVKDFKSNFVFGNSDWVVVEADEFDRSFMHLTPEIAVLLSVDPDHLDIYGNHEEMLKTFRDFTLQVKSGGSLLVAADVMESIDLAWKKALLQKDIKLYSFGIDQGWFSSGNIHPDDHQFGFDFSVGGAKKLSSSLAMPGNHNISNATAALGVAHLIGADFDGLKEGVAGFSGINRRFDFVFKSDNQVYIDDYAHHPSEIKAAIHAARNLYPGKKLSVIFQPHLFSRTRDFLDGFAEELAKADELILMEIYPAREKPIEGITTSRIVELTGRDDVKVLNENQIIDYVTAEKTTFEVLMTIGAGDIDRLIKPLGAIFKS